MKSKLSILLLLIINFSCQAQSEPETVRGKDLLDKIDRSEIEANEIAEPIELETEIPKLEFEKIELENPKENKPKAKVEKTAETKVSKPIETIEPKQDVEGVIEAEDTESQLSKNKTILISKRKLSISNLLVGDKVVNNDGLTYIYRTGKSDTVQYKFVGKIPYSSQGLKKISNDRYELVNLDTLISDTNNTSSSVEKVNSESQTIPVKTVDNEPKKGADESVKTSSVSRGVDDIKKEMQEKLNEGKEITKNIYLFGLLKNDIIHVSEDVQLVVRRNRNSYAIEHYWLTEKINPNSKSLKSLSDNQYKVLDDRYDSGE